MTYEKPRLTPEEMLEIENELLRGMAERYGRILEAHKRKSAERKRAAHRRASEALKKGEKS